MQCLAYLTEIGNTWQKLSYAYSTSLAPSYLSHDISTHRFIKLIISGFMFLWNTIFALSACSHNFVAALSLCCCNRCCLCNRYSLLKPQYDYSNAPIVEFADIRIIHFLSSFSGNQGMRVFLQEACRILCNRILKLIFLTQRILFPWIILFPEHTDIGPVRLSAQHFVMTVDIESG